MLSIDLWFLCLFEIQIDYLEVHGSWLKNYISLLACEMNTMVNSFEHSLALPFFEIGMKTDFSSPAATVEFSKFAGILSVALSQHHLSGFEIAQLKFITSTSFVHSDPS